MKILFVNLLLFSLLYSVAQSNNNEIKASVSDSVASTHLVYSGNLAELNVEKVIYNSPECQNFLLRFTIRNVSKKTIGVDLSSYWTIVYPNQWGVYSKPYREVVDEKQIIPDTVIDKTELVNRYRNNTLTMIEPDQTFSYYREWNGSGEKANLTDPATFLIITVDGYLLISDGTGFEQIVLINYGDDKRAVVFNFPLVFKTVPGKAEIIKSN
ncbi:MAG: hypothetical protein CVU11_15915 [Bacteroidetes bacterium HGW-Bacteroidetes-6]|jgi:hypothetical protein|nr:MAG: hypothetical protein CVU11_15915 [Bacteroidetes bacterium HGW-Bacteroidetes-6]